MNILEACVAALRVQPHQTASQVAKAIGEATHSVRSILGRNTEHRFAVVKRRRNKYSDVWEYSTYQEVRP